MEPAVLDLSEVGRCDVARAGGKGANLGEMIRHGFPVPPGFVVSAGACREFYQQVGLAAELAGLGQAGSEESDRICRAIRETINRSEMPTALAEAVTAAHDRLGRGQGRDVVVVVRSSATAEDLGEASFAGQHATYYYVTGDRLLHMIKQCWASLWSPEAVSYRNIQGLDHGSVYMAVVVQEMILSEVSGVTFTVNPVSGDASEIVTEASWGLGAAMVDGRVTPDHFIMHRHGLGLKEKRIACKRFMVPPVVADGGGSRLCEVPHHLQYRATLTEEQAGQVAAWAIRAEEHFGSPQDVEWAFARGRFYLLQSRPITIRGREDITAGVTGRWVLFKPLAENFSNPLTPLTADIAAVLFAPPLLKQVKGWYYINLDLIRKIMPWRFSDRDLFMMLYGLGARAPKGQPSLVQFGRFLIFAAWFYLTFGVFFSRTDDLPPDFMDRFRDLARRVDQDRDLDVVGAMARVFFWHRFLQPVGEQPIIVNLSAGRYMLVQEILQKVVRRYLPDLPEDAESLLSSGADQVYSAEMGRAIWELAREAGASSRVKELLGHNKPAEVLAKLRSEPQAVRFLAGLNEFVAKHGHRCLKELELASPRWEEDPTAILGMVRNYMLVESDPAVHEGRVTQARRDLETLIKSRLEDRPLERLFRPRWRLIRFLAEKVKYYSRMRENSRFYHIMAFSTVRRKILKLEARLLEQGRLKCRNDVFYLYWQEIRRLRDGELTWPEVEGRIRARRLEYVRLSKMTPPKAINVDLEEGSPDETPTAEDRAVLRGQSASPGCFQGLAHVILDPSLDIELSPGEILVAPYTDPAWTPLFLTAGAAVVEVGSYLSHAGTVAREYGLPCVVDVSDCTRIIQSGCRVEVDGDRGLVRIIDPQGGAKT